LFDEGSLTVVAFPDHGFGHLVLDVGPLAHAGIVLQLVALQREMRKPAAMPAAVLAAVGVEAGEDFVLLLGNVHDRGERAEGTLLQALKAGL